MIADGSSCKVIGKGRAKIKGKDRTVQAPTVVRFVPEAPQNLISLSVLDSNGIQIHMRKGISQLAKKTG